MLVILRCKEEIVESVWPNDVTRSSCERVFLYSGMEREAMNKAFASKVQVHAI